ncbi:MAG: DoxX family membrane protein [Abditibacteriaceae bacterium]
MKRYLPVIARILMGIVFLIMGLNGFLNFIPQPKTSMPAGAMEFADALMKSGYMMQLVSGTQLVVGILLLSNRFVPLALALIAPVIVNIIAFHVFLVPEMIAPGIIVAILEVYLAWVYRKVFFPMLEMKVAPDSSI